MRDVPPRWADDGWPDNAPAWHSQSDDTVLGAARELMAPHCAVAPSRRRWLAWAALWQISERLRRETALAGLLALALVGCADVSVLDDTTRAQMMCARRMSWARTFADSSAIAKSSPAGWTLQCGDLIAAPAPENPLSSATRP